MKSTANDEIKPLPSMRIYNSIEISAADVYRLSIEILCEYHVSSKLLGYNLIIECVNAIIGYSGDDIVYSTYIYPRVASIYHKTPTNVEKCIRMSINKAKNERPELFDNSIFGTGKLSNVVFINHVTEEVRKRYIFEMKK